MMRPALALAVLLLALLPGTTRAQDLREFTQRFTLSWARNDAGRLVGSSAGNGISMDVGGRDVGPLKSRQAAATLRRLFDERETISVTLLNQRELPGSPRRAYLELIWVRRARGTTIPERVTVFVALVAEDDDWRITQIRLIP